MGFIEDRPRAIYLNVANGAFVFKIDGEVRHIKGYAGCISGIQVKDAEYQGRKSKKLEIRMEDTQATGSARHVIISGTLIDTMGKVTTFGRMIVSRLASKEAPQPGEEIEIGAYSRPDFDPKITMASLRRRGVKDAIPPLEAIEAKKADFAACRELVERAVAYLITKYGDFESQPSYLSTALHTSEYEDEASPMGSDDHWKGEQSEVTREAFTNAQADPRSGDPRSGDPQSNDRFDTSAPVFADNDDLPF